MASSFCYLPGESGSCPGLWWGIYLDRIHIKNTVNNAIAIKVFLRDLKNQEEKNSNHQLWRFFNYHVFETKVQTTSLIQHLLRHYDLFIHYILPKHMYQLFFGCTMLLKLLNTILLRFEEYLVTDNGGGGGGVGYCHIQFCYAHKLKNKVNRGWGGGGGGLTRTSQ